MATRNPTRAPTPVRGSDIRGVAQLGVDAVIGVTAVVEHLHATIQKRPGPLGKEQQSLTTGLTGLIYGAVKGTTRLVGKGLDAGLSLLDGQGAGRASTPQREAVIAALNGVWGDHLAASGNPLAIRMAWRVNGQALDMQAASLKDECPAATGRILVLVHGLCMNDLQWTRNGHDHGQALARDAGFTPVYLHYNTGLHIAENGRRFDELLDALVSRWPVPVEELCIVGHSMGGLVTRSACHFGDARGAPWRQYLCKLVCLGTPHHGAPLERGGHLVDAALGVSPYAAPFARLGSARSAGVTDLRYGNVHEDDLRGRSRHAQGHDDRHAVPLPRSVDVFLVAATRGESVRGRHGALEGDGLVPLASALGEHAQAALAVTVPAARRLIITRANHFDLLDRSEVYAQLLRWLG